MESSTQTTPTRAQVIIMPKTNILCPNCDTRLSKTSVKHVYLCNGCGDSFRKSGNHLQYADDLNSQTFSLEYYRKK